MLSKAINNGFFTDEQERQVNEMIDSVAFKGKRAPQMLGRNCALVIDDSIAEFQYVKDFLSRKV